MQLYNDGLDDVAMADALGITEKRVKNWRLRMHLKRPLGRPKKKEEEVKHFNQGLIGEGTAEEVVEEASCRQVSELPETQEIPENAVNPEAEDASGTSAFGEVKRSEAIRVREMFALLEKLVQAGLGDAPTQIDGTYIKDFYAVSILRTKDGISIDLTTMR